MDTNRNQKLCDKSSTSLNTRGHSWQKNVVISYIFGKKDTKACTGLWNWNMNLPFEWRHLASHIFLLFLPSIILQCVQYRRIYTIEC
jgi:hypothetical protein